MVIESVRSTGKGVFARLLICHFITHLSPVMISLVVFYPPGAAIARGCGDAGIEAFALLFVGLVFNGAPVLLLKLNQSR
jgi:hypothetical protein